MLRAAILLILLPAKAIALTCSLTFSVHVTHGIGTYPPGTDLQGAAQFETLRSFRQEGGATAHLATGTMSLDGHITGRLWTLITTSRTVAADLVGLYALDVEGLSFVGQEFRGPMAITLYGDPGSWPYARPPISQEEWDSLTLRRVFQLHAPDSNDMLGGDVTALTASCIDSPEEQP
ncbi:hypothetical protein [Nioella nitratireducens]|uniref:hypothetical protein n=1 Tax=Nioella nitratireducens TaxID=1287720 RepID=UPI0008FD67A6|nr:hypothetical protein [Nioella nitratireducens]